MKRRRTQDLDAAEALLARAEAALVPARASFQALVRSLVDQLPDPRRAHAVGRMLEDIARGRLYVLAGHASLDDFLRAALGISRTTAYRLRRIARTARTGEAPERGKRKAYEAARAAEARSRRRR